ncbi:MAG: hypothetical protein ACAI38_08395 [Myxococcota bacterium]|nr:hypothetical protein [Myxococcota bacterium]
MGVGGVSLLGGVAPGYSNTVASVASPLERPTTGVVASPPRANLIRVADATAGPQIAAPGESEGPTYRRVIENRPAFLADWQAELRRQGRLTDALVVGILAGWEGIQAREIMSVEVVNALLASAYRPQHIAQVAGTFGVQSGDLARADSAWGRFLARLTPEQRARLDGHQMTFAEAYNIWYRGSTEHPTEAGYEPVLRSIRWTPRDERWAHQELFLRFHLAGRGRDFNGAVAKMSPETKAGFKANGMTLAAFQSYLTAAGAGAIPD